MSQPQLFDMAPRQKVFGKLVTECRKGHAITADNVCIRKRYGKTHRECKECKREQNRRRSAGGQSEYRLRMAERRALMAEREEINRAPGRKIVLGLPLRFLLGAWSAGGHSFDDNMKCTFCRKTYDAHQAEPAECRSLRGV